MGGVAEENLSLFNLRQGFDLWMLRLEPLLDQSRVSLLCTVQRLLAGDAELRQQPAN